MWARGKGPEEGGRNYFNMDGEKASWHRPVCPATQPTHLRGSLPAPETMSFLWAGTRIGIFFFFFLRNSFSMRCCTSRDKQTKTAGCRWCPQVLSGVPSSVGSLAPGGLLLPYTKLPGSMLPPALQGLPWKPKSWGIFRILFTAFLLPLSSFLSFLL